MPEPGGPAAIHGILYQILANLWRVSEIQLDAKVQGQEVRSARLILEPKGGGGDTRYEGEGVRIIEQYKTRGHNRTWSLRELIEDVLPDLFVAVDPERLTEVSTYRFVTEGRCGGSVHSPNFQRCLARFKSKPTPEDLLGGLDDTQAHHFFKQGNFTDRALFLHISARVRPRGDQTEDALHHYKVWHLLAGFEICDRMSASNLIQNIDAFLIQVVDRREGVDVKRRELCTILMELSCQGHFACTPEEILQHARLNAITLSAFGKLKARLRSLAEEEFRREGYAGEKDVRSVPEWPSACSILVLMGESGQGKTWQLFRLADPILASDRLAVIVGATGNADGDLQKASDRVWREGLNHDAPLDISRLAARRAEVLKPPPADEDWLTVCTDDVQEIGEARQLVRQPWKRWGIKLALTVPTVVGKALAGDRVEGMHILDVPDFTPKETREYLKRRGYDWGEIPDDVRIMLCRPILAEFYCNVAGTEGWAPHNEYELYERFWQRVTNERDQPHHPSDRGILLMLAGSVIKEKAQYPRPQDLWQHLGLSDEALRRLESIGWLRRGRRGDVKIWHDRLLHWAVGEWLIDQRRTNRIEQSELTELLCRMYQHQPTFAGKRLGYVPMDYLWLACDPANKGPDAVLQQDVPTMLQALEEHPSSGGNPEEGTPSAGGLGR